MVVVILLGISQDNVVIILCEIFAIGLTTLLAFDVTLKFESVEKYLFCIKMSSSPFQCFLKLIIDPISHISISNIRLSLC